MISFWTKILTCTENKIVCVLYDFLRMQHFKEGISNSWINCIHKILSLCGVSNIWQEQNSLDKNFTIAIVRQRLNDQFIQKWESDINNSSKGQIYRIFKSHFGREKYLEILPAKLRKTYIKFRTSNHRLPIETGRWTNVPLCQRFCTLCNSGQIADEFHYILECKSLCAVRKEFLPPRYCINPNVIKFSEILSTTSAKKLRNLCTFITKIYDLVCPP